MLRGFAYVLYVQLYCRHRLIRLCAMNTPAEGDGGDTRLDYGSIIEADAEIDSWHSYSVDEALCPSLLAPACAPCAPCKMQAAMTTCEKAPEQINDTAIPSKGKRRFLPKVRASHGIFSEPRRTLLCAAGRRGGGVGPGSRNVCSHSCHRWVFLRSSLWRDSRQNTI